MGTTIRASDRAHAVLRRLADEQHSSLTEALDTIADEWEKMQFFRTLNEAYAALREDEKAWNDELIERSEWDNALMDDVAEDDESTETEPR